MTANVASARRAENHVPLLVREMCVCKLCPHQDEQEEQREEAQSILWHYPLLQESAGSDSGPHCGKK